jgi:SWIM zinc finger
MGWYSSWSPSWAPRPTAAQRQQKAKKQIAALEKKGKKLSPVLLEGRKIASTFWGKAWCDNLESYSDYENRLPRGRSYVRSGSVLDLQIEPSRISALVQGTSLYTVGISISAVEEKRWKAVVAECGGKIDSVVELLQGKLSKPVMEVITRKESGLFPEPRQIKMSCSCPDWADMCKHVAAVLYGVGARLDQQPDLLFRLRGADPMELIARAASGAVLGGKAPAPGKRLGADLSSVFGIELDLGEGTEVGVEPAAPPAKAGAKPKPKKAARAAAKVAATPPAPQAPALIKGPELRRMGVPAGTVQSWLKSGVLKRTETPGVYEETDESRARLSRYARGKEGSRS